MTTHEIGKYDKMREKKKKKHTPFIASLLIGFSFALLFPFSFTVSVP